MIKELDQIYNELLQIYHENALNNTTHNLFYERPSKEHISNDSRRILLSKYNEIKRKLTEKFGIVGGGIGLLDTVEGRPNLLFARKIKECVFDTDINKLEILDFEYPEFEDSKELINLSFFAVREVEVPEYISLLNNPQLSCIEKQKFLNDNRFLWVTHKEISKTVRQYQFYISSLFHLENITNYSSLSSFLNKSQYRNTPSKYIIDLVEGIDNNDRLKNKLITALNTYIKNISSIKPGSFSESDILNEITLLQSKSTFPLLSYSFLYCFAEKEPNFSHIVFPLWNTYSDLYSYSIKSSFKNEYSLVHGLYTIDNNKIEIDEELLIELKLVVKQFVEPIVDKEHYQKNKEVDLRNILKQSNLNAIAVVMARNMSHNIGSHVLSRLVSPSNVDIDKIVSSENTHYKSFYEKKMGALRENALEEEIQKQEKEYQTKLTCIKNKDECEIKELIKLSAKRKFYDQLISTFFSYLKTRQDFLADVVTGVPQVQSSKQFKKELMEGIDSNRILLNRISGVSNFPYTFCFEGRIADEDIPVAISNDVMGQHAFYVILENIIRNTAKHGGGKSKTEPNDPNKFTIRVENSTLDSSYYRVTVFDDQGYDENDKSYLMIRKSNPTYINTKKRLKIELSTENGKPQGNKLEEINKEAWVKGYTERLNVQHDGKSELKHEGSDENYDYFSIKKIDKLIINQNIWINKKILDDEFKLRQGALGLIEMESCAAYLRRIPVEDIEADRFELAFNPGKINRTREEIIHGIKELPILRAVNPVRLGKKERENVLGYQFYLPKPKKLLILDFNGEEWNKVTKTGTCEEDLKKFEENGILLLKVKGENEKELLNSKWYYHKNKQKIYQHEIMLLVGKGDNSELEDHQHLLPSRWVGFDAVVKYFDDYKSQFDNLSNDKKFGYEISCEINTSRPNAIIRETWRCYVNKLFLQRKVKKAWPDGKYTRLFLKNNTSHIKPTIILSTHCFNEDKYIEGTFLAVLESRYNYLKDALIESDKEDRKESFNIPFKEGKNFELMSKFVDATLSNICVIDERIQEQAELNEYTTESTDECPNGTTKPYQYWWNLQNVFIPKRSDFNLSETTYPENLDKTINKTLKDEFLTGNREIKGLKWLVIHLGVIEKIIAKKNDLRKDENNDRQKVIDKILDSFTDVQVIITSGRAPKDLSDKWSYLSYSVISQYLIENRFKLLLNEVLNAARPKQEKNG